MRSIIDELKGRRFQDCLMLDHGLPCLIALIDTELAGAQTRFHSGLLFQFGPCMIYLEEHSNEQSLGWFRLILRSLCSIGVI